MKTVIILIITCSLLVSAGSGKCPIYGQGSPAKSQMPEHLDTFLPAGDSVEAVRRNPGNVIDGYVFRKLNEMGIRAAYASTDAEFIRRVTLDLTGRIPEGDRVLLFIRDSNPDKRARLIDELIASGPFVDRWTFWLEELIRSTSNHSGVTVVGRNLLHAQLHTAMTQSVPFNRIVSQLIASTGSVAENGFVTFLARRTTATEPIQDTWDDLAADTGRIFLGIPLLCLSCHDGALHLEPVNTFLSRHTRAEFWSQAAFFSRLSITRVNGAAGSQPSAFSDAASGNYDTDTTANPGMRSRRSGGPYTPAFFLTGARPVKSDYRAEFARLLTSDFQFSRAAVNNIWAELFGMGIVDPPDAFDLARYEEQASYPELLDALAKDFQANGYDLRRTIRTIANSRAYQISSRYPQPQEWKEGYRRFFARRIIRRLDAEEIHDSILQATGAADRYTVEGLNRPVSWAVQLPDVNEPRANPSASVFLDVLGRGRRMDDYGFRSAEISIAGSLSTMNSPFVTSKTTVKGSPVLQRLLREFDDGEFVQQLFVHTLSRLPTAEEQRISQVRRGTDRTRWAEMLQWALVNKVEFSLNY